MTKYRKKTEELKKSNEAKNAFHKKSSVNLRNEI